MFAKLICQSNSTDSFASALDRTLRALDEFHIAGLPTNLEQLRAILSHPAVRAGDARTTLVRRASRPRRADRRAGVRLGLAGAARTAGDGAARRQSRARPVRCAAGLGRLGRAERRGGRRKPDGGRGHRAPRGGRRHGRGWATTLMVISAMKMETAITAPCAGVVTEIRPTEIGANVARRPDHRHHRASSSAAATQPRRATMATTPGRRCLPTCRHCRTIAHRRFAPDSKDPGVVRQRASRQADLPRAHRPAARRRQLSRGRQPRRLRRL